MQIEEIQAAIEALPQESYSQLRQWFSERDWEQWDQEIVADSNKGKLDFLVREALDEKAQGNLREL